MKVFIIALLCILAARLACSQTITNVMVGGGFDLFKTDNRKVFDKAQVGLEANYFVARHFAVGGGVEIWTQHSSSFVMGMRWYADDHFFVRLRTLIGANQASLGVGWSKPIAPDWRVEALGDFYLDGNLAGSAPAFALRAGVAYILH